jgi:hypothetical protein
VLIESGILQLLGRGSRERVVFDDVLRNCACAAIYMLGKNWKRRVEHVGAKAGYDPEAALIV